MGSISRRVFLKTSAAFSAAAAAPSSAVSPNERISTAIIGCRNQGTNVAASLLDTGVCDIVTLCDCDEAMFAPTIDKLGDRLHPSCALVKDFRRVLEDKSIDAVVVATPDHSHALITCRALEAGKHVYIEKPASYNIADGQAMTAAEQKHPNLTVLVGTQQRSGAHFQEAREFVRSDGVGRPAFCRAFTVHERGFLKPVPDSDPPPTLDYDLWLGPAPYRPYNASRVHYNWRFIRDYGTGEMGNWGAHWLDVILWYLDLELPASVTGLGGQYVVKDAKEWPDTQTVLYEYPELTVLWELRLWAKNTPGIIRGSGAEISGEKGSLVITRGNWTFFPKEGEPEVHAGSEQDKAHARNFADSIRGLVRPVAPLKEGVRCAALCHLANIATTVNRRLEIDPAAGTVRGDPEAQALESREYRAPYALPT